MSWQTVPIHMDGLVKHTGVDGKPSPARGCPIGRCTHLPHPSPSRTSRKGRPTVQVWFLCCFFSPFRQTLSQRQSIVLDAVDAVGALWELLTLRPGPTSVGPDHDTCCADRPDSRVFGRAYGSAAMPHCVVCPGSRCPVGHGSRGTSSWVAVDVGNRCTPHHGHTDTSVRPRSAGGVRWTTAAACLAGVPRGRGLTLPVSNLRNLDHQAWSAGVKR